MINNYFSKSTLAYSILILFLFVFTQKGYTQKNLWTDLEEGKDITLKNGKEYFTKYRLVSLDYDAMKTHLLSSPRELSSTSFKAEVIIELPLPYGGFSKFKVIETPVMNVELAQKYPNIKTYTAISLDDPFAVAKIDVGVLGFHAMVLSPTGRYFVDPITVDNHSAYRSYYRKDVLNISGFTCAVESDEIFQEETKERLNEYRRNFFNAPVELRTYRLAVSCTGEYASVKGGTVESALAGIVSTVNRVTGVYETELAIRLELIADNDLLVFTNSSTDPFTNDDPFALLTENQTTITNTIGSANYDIGHVFATSDGGLAGLGVVCINQQKARGMTGLPNPTGDVFAIDYVCHEMGHQFGANHTFNGTLGSCAGGTRNASTAYEPGSGSTIMAYAGICSNDNLQSNSDPYFHAASIDEIRSYVTVSSGNSCPVKTATGNNPPVVDAGNNYIIPINTPFVLTGSATDPEADPLTYSWEQMDLGPAGGPNSPTGNAPLFRVFSPVSAPVRYFPQLSTILNNTQMKGEVLPSILRNMNFRLVARDNKPMGGTTAYDQMLVSVTNIAGPFKIANFNLSDTLYVGTTETISWDVAGTDLSPVSCAEVNILMSTDGGLTFPVVLADHTQNDGSEEIIIPSNPTVNARIKIQAAENIFFDINNANLTVMVPAAPDFTLSTAVVKDYVCPPDSAQYEITVTPLLGYNLPVTLTPSNLPASSTAFFTVNPVMPGDKTTLKITTNGVSAGNKSFVLAGSSGTISHAANLSFTVVNSVSDQVSLVSPTDMQQNVNPIAALSWNIIPNATKYNVVVATDQNFTNNVIDTVLMGSDISTFTTPKLGQNTQFYWKVRGQNNCSEAPFSSIRTFTTNGVPAAPTDLMISSVNDNDVTLIWTDNATNENNYKVERSEDDNQHYIQISALPSNTTTYTSNNLVFDKTYFFRVRNSNLIGNSGYSNEVSVSLTTGLDNNTSSKMIWIYPNPGKGLFNIKTSSLEQGKMQLEVTDELGRIIQKMSFTKDKTDFQYQLDLSNEANGIYFVKILLPQSQIVNRLIKW